jgi:signal transduction histidine kinase
MEHRGIEYRIMQGIQRGEITRVLLNLISNGVYAAMKRKAETRLDGYEPTLAAATRSLGNNVEIRIRDNGGGIPAEIREKVCHVWTAPCWQELSSRFAGLVGAAMCSAF